MTAPRRAIRTPWALLAAALLTGAGIASVGALVLTPPPRVIQAPAVRYTATATVTATPSVTGAVSTATVTAVVTAPARAPMTRTVPGPTRTIAGPTTTITRTVTVTAAPTPAPEETP